MSKGFTLLEVVVAIREPARNDVAIGAADGATRFVNPRTGYAL